MYRLDRAKRAAILALLVEGMSIRATCRITSISKPTVTKLLTDIGPVVAAYQGEAMRELRCQRVEVGEIWAFVGMKAKRVPAERRGEFGVGDVYTFTAIDPDTKLAPTWMVGQRDGRNAQRFLLDLGRRIQGRFQLTTDGASFYREAVGEAFGATVDYAQLVKLYSAPPASERAYSPPVCVAARPVAVYGDPDPGHISTSLVERQNLTMRMSMRRFTRLTNAFSKKVYNLSCAVALHFMHYNYVRPHTTLTRANYGRPTTPAMAAGLEPMPWTFGDIVALLEEREEDARDVSRRRRDFT